LWTGEHDGEQQRGSEAEIEAVSERTEDSYDAVKGYEGVAFYRIISIKG
jgi:hypothetical protein